MFLESCYIGSHYDFLNKLEGQKLEQKLKSTQPSCYFPLDMGRYCKKSGHCKYNCLGLKKQKERNDQIALAGVA